MTLTDTKLLAAILIFLLAVVSAWLPFRKRASDKAYQFSAGEALASGIFLGAGIMHMLPEANADFVQLNYHYPIAYLLAGGTFLLLLLLEHVGRERQHKSHSDAPVIILLALFMLIIHSFLEGVALGVTHSVVDLSILFVAVVAHKWAAGFSLAIKLNSTHLSLRKNIIYYGLFALMTPLGILFATTLFNSSTEHSAIKPLFTALAAGTFIYIGTLHGLNRSIMVERCCNIKEFFWVIIGFSSMALAALVEIH